jgi:protein-tyrosine phosphatase
MAPDDLRDGTRHHAFELLVNFRDVGGYPTADDRTVRWGRFYRSDALGKLHGPDWDRFLALGVRTVIDLRYPFEIAARGRVPAHASIAYHNLCIEQQPYDQAVLAADVEPARHYADKLLEVAHEGTAELSEALRVIAADGAAPVVVHCAAGKDRTGLLTALVLGLAGVGDADIVADYALSERATDRFVAFWRERHERPGKPPLWPGYGRAPAAAMRLFLDELAAAHGSLREYARRRLGADDALVAALRRQLL